MSKSAWMSIISKTVGASLKQYEFRSLGKQAWTRAYSEIVHTVGIQSSSKSNEHELIVTANLGVFSSRLAQALHFNPKARDISSCHLRLRVGRLTDSPADRWWTISTDEEAMNCGKEFADLIVLKGLPILDRIRTTSDLEHLVKTSTLSPLASIIAFDRLRELLNIEQP